MLATEIKNCLSCPSRQFFDKSIAAYEDGILKKPCKPYCRYSKRAFPLKVRESRNGIPAKCPRRNKGVKLYLLRFTPEKLMTNEDGSIGGFSHTFVCGVRKAPDEVFHELDKALQLLQKNAAVDILFQRGDVLEADSEFGTRTWEYTGDSWNPRFQLNPAQVKNIPKGALHNAR